MYWSGTSCKQKEDEERSGLKWCFIYCDPGSQFARAIQEKRRTHLMGARQRSDILSSQANFAW